MNFLSGEFILKGRANGGTVVALRSLWVTTWGYAAIVALIEILNPQSLFVFSGSSLRETVFSSLPVAAALLGGAYTALYARFASQWTYLSGLYNQIMAAKVKGVGDDDDARRALVAWEAGFIEDAEELHLAAKPMFAGVVASLLQDPDVRTVYVTTTIRGEAKLRDLEARVQKALGKATVQRQSPQLTHERE